MRCWQGRLGLACTAAAAVFAFLSGAGPAEFNAPKEQQVKAAFIYNFAKFVEWPAHRFPTTNAPVVIGVLGQSSINPALDEVIRGRNINGHPLSLCAVSTPDAARNTHILVCTGADDDLLGQVLPALGGAGVLTVGESDRFDQPNGVIRFLLEGDKVRFEINMQAAEATGIRISAQLQKLAKFVRRKN